MSIRVLIVDDQAMVRTGFQMILEHEEDIEVVGQAADGLEAVAACKKLDPDVVLMDIRMPNLDGLAATRQIAAGGPAAPRVLVLTTFDADEYVYEALRSGSSGFLLKDVPAEQLVGAVRTVAAGEALLAPSVTRRLIDRFAQRGGTATPAASEGMETLTEREGEVLGLVARGLSNAEIADELVISRTTAKTHVARILMKLGLRDRVQAVVFAYENGIIEPGEVAG